MFSIGIIGVIISSVTEINNAIRYAEWKSLHFEKYNRYINEHFIKNKADVMRKPAVWLGDSDWAAAGIPKIPPSSSFESVSSGIGFVGAMLFFLVVLSIGLAAFINV